MPENAQTTVDPDILLPAHDVVEVKPAYKTAEPSTVFMGGLFTLAALWALNTASEIIIPVVLAFTLKLVLLPVMNGFARLRIPRVIAAILVLSLLIGGVFGIVTVLAPPAMEWAQDLPKEFPKIRDRINELRNPIEPLQKILSDAEELGIMDAADNNTTVVTVQQPTMRDRILASAGVLATGTSEMLLVLFFLLVAGDTFLRRLVEILPRFSDKKQAINISDQIQRDISAYLITITCMNTLVGAGTAAAMYFCGVDDPVLWGICAFLLNYVPIVGPIAGVMLFGMVGMMTELTLGEALLPAVIYLGIHITESQFITPLLLARHFTLNPVLVILGLIFFYWMWGIAGAILSTPIIAIIKIICDNVIALKPFGHFIEG